MCFARLSKTNHNHNIANVNRVVLSADNKRAREAMTSSDAKKSKLDEPSTDTNTNNNNDSNNDESKKARVGKRSGEFANRTKSAELNKVRDSLSNLVFCCFVTLQT
jgi:hypothetical protein